MLGANQLQINRRGQNVAQSSGGLSLPRRGIAMRDRANHAAALEKVPGEA
jgi:hypothetical protein